MLKTNSAYILALAIAYFCFVPLLAVTRWAALESIDFFYSILPEDSLHAAALYTANSILLIGVILIGVMFVALVEQIEDYE